MTSGITRRAFLGAACTVGSALLVGKDVNTAMTDKAKDKVSKIRPEENSRKPSTLKVAVVQFRSSRDLDENVLRHCDYIRRCGKEGVRVVVFPECSVTGYFEEAIEKAEPEALKDAEAAIAAAAKGSDVYAVIGIPTKNGSTTYNSAVVLTPEGKILERYHKVQLAESWPAPGDHMSVFPIDGTLCSIIICHDERYPELVRLPVIAGARIVFYISSESGIREEKKIAPYRAQIMARAVENNVYIAHANTPADKQTLEGSHGQSRLIAPDGNIIVEASIFEEEVISADFDLTKATGHLANRSLDCEFLRSWWEQGVRMVRTIKG